MTTADERRPLDVDEGDVQEQESVEEDAESPSEVTEEPKPPPPDVSEGDAAEQDREP